MSVWLRLAYLLAGMLLGFQMTYRIYEGGSEFMVSVGLLLGVVLPAIAAIWIVAWFGWLEWQPGGIFYRGERKR